MSGIGSSRVKAAAMALDEANSALQRTCEVYCKERQEKKTGQQDCGFQCCLRMPKQDRCTRVLIAHVTELMKVVEILMHTIEEDHERTGKCHDATRIEETHQVDLSRR